MPFSTLNKAADVAPELLIGAAVDVVVRGEASWLGQLLGIEDRFEQLLVLAAVNVVVWVIESATDYVAHILWRNLAQTMEHELRVEAYAHVQELEVAWFEDTTSGGLLAIVFVLSVVGADGPAVDWLCAAVLVARVCQSLVHVSHVQTDAFVAVRFSFFSVQLVCFLALIVIAARHGA